MLNIKYSKTIENRNYFKYLFFLMENYRKRRSCQFKVQGSRRPNEHWICRAFSFAVLICTQLCASLSDSILDDVYVLREFVYVYCFNKIHSVVKSNKLTCKQVKCNGIFLTVFPYFFREFCCLYFDNKIHVVVSPVLGYYRPYTVIPLMYRF